MSISPISTMSDAALQAEPASKARGYWATVGRRIVRDKVSMVCAFVLIAIFLSALLAPWLGLADPYQGSMIRRLGLGLGAFAISRAAGDHDLGDPDGHRHPHGARAHR